jgi:predicted phosphodiesterase
MTADQQSAGETPAKPRIAILGDIHANIDALDTVLADARARGVTRYLCVGDVVGYNAAPRECIDRLLELHCLTVRGNHDHYTAHAENLEGFHPLAADVIHWTRTQLEEPHLAFLRGLQYVAQVDRFTLVHSTLDTPEMWGYVFDKFEAEANFNYQTRALCFFGHTHVPLAFEKTASVAFGMYQKIQVALGRKYFVNVGSVGQPRDGDPRAAYVLYDLNTNLIELHRLDYDIARAQARIREAQLPERLAARLDLGR